MWVERKTNMLVFKTIIFLLFSLLLPVNSAISVENIITKTTSQRSISVTREQKLDISTKQQDPQGEDVVIKATSKKNAQVSRKFKSQEKSKKPVASDVVEEPAVAYETEPSVGDAEAPVVSAEAPVVSAEAPVVETSAVEKVQATAPLRVDDSVLWELFTAGKFELLHKKIAVIKKQHPDWQVSSLLLSLMTMVQADQKLLIARKKGDYAAALSLYKKSPEAFGCERLGWAFFLTEGQVRSGDKRAARSTYIHLLDQCNEDQRLSSIEHALGILELPVWQPLVMKEMEKDYSDDNRERLHNLLYKVLLQNIQLANDDRDFKKVLSIGSVLDPLVLKHDDPKAAAIVAWAYFNAEKFEKALSSFNFAYNKSGNLDALRGKVFTLARLKRFDELSALVKSKRSVLIKAGVMKDLLPALAGYALTEKKYKYSLDLLTELEAIRPLTFDEMSTKSWSYYHFAAYTKAAESFEALYRLKRDDNAARGLYYSLEHSGDIEKMDRLGDELGGYFHVMVERRHIDKLYNLKQFMAVNARNPEYSELLHNIDEPFVRASYMARSVSGTNIFSRMVLRKSILEGRNVYGGTHEWNVRVEQLNLTAGNGLILDPGFNVGTMKGGVITNNTPLTRHTGYEWSIGYAHEGEGTISLEAGQTVIRTAIKNDFKFRAGYARQFETNAFQISAYRQPLRENMIAYIGMPDPYLGVDSWGQVSRNGAELSAYQSLAFDLSLGGNLVGEKRVGHNVKKNNHVSTYIGLSYQPPVPGFNYFSVGPFVRWEHSTMNQNHTTIGHGNYFSPQWLLDWGVGTSMTTELGKRWLIVTNASIGRQSIRENAAPFFPLANLGLIPAPGFHPGARKIEYHYQYDVAVVIALADRWRLNAEYKQARSWTHANVLPYMDRAIMLSLSYHFEDRGTKLLQRDLASYRLQPLY